MRPIDADKFKENMRYVCDAGGWLEPVTKAVTEYVIKQIDAQPTVDVWEIVYEELTKLRMFTGIYDANHGDEHFMYGVQAVMEVIAERAGHQDLYTLMHK